MTYYSPSSHSQSHNNNPAHGTTPPDQNKHNAQDILHKLEDLQNQSNAPTQNINPPHQDTYRAPQQQQVQQPIMPQQAQPQYQASTTYTQTQPTQSYAQNPPQTQQTYQQPTTQALPPQAVNQEQQPHPNPQVMYSWKAPLRAYKKQGGKIMRFYIVLCILLSLIVYFFGDYILLIPIWSLLFLFYVLTITPPPDVENKITQFGIETGGITLRWEALSYYYFSQRFNFDVLTIVSIPPYNLHTYLIVPNEEIKENVMTLLSQHIMFQENPRRTLTDRMTDWLTQLVPDEEEEEHKEVTHHEEQEKQKRGLFSSFPFFGKKTAGV